MDQAQNLRNIVKTQKDQQNLARVITITSGKGGVGKSSVSVNLALQLGRLGKKVVILDADFGLANIEVMLGIRPKYNLADLMFRGKSLTEIITVGPEEVGFISGGSGIHELTNLTREQIIHLSKRLCELDQSADIILVDTGAGISDSVLEFVMASSEVLLIATPEPTSITDAYALLKTMDKKDAPVEEITIKMIANRVHTIKEGKELYQKLNTVVDKFLRAKLEFLGAIPNDPNMSKALMKQKPVVLLYPESNASKAILELAKMIMTSEVVEQKERKGITNLFSKLIHYHK